jgi:hypothetical protein
MNDPCQVYWGSHGCSLQRGHEQPCECDCCDCPEGAPCEPYCVAKAPYYGTAETRFYGEDAITRGLPLIEAYGTDSADL